MGDIGENMEDKIKKIEYKICDFETVGDEKRRIIVEKIKEIIGVLDAKIDEENKSLIYIVDANSGDYEIFSSVMHLLEDEGVDLAFEDEKIVPEEVNEIESETEEVFADEKEESEKKEKKYEKIENIVVLSLSAVLIVLGFVFDKLGFLAARWVYMFGYAFAGYETLYSMITDIAEKRYAGEKIIVLAASFLLLFMGNGLLGSVVLFGFSLISCLYSAFGNITDRLSDLGVGKDDIKTETKESDYFVKKKAFIYDVVIVAIGLLIIFLLPLTSIKQYWNVLTQKWLNVGIGFIVIAFAGFRAKSVITNVVFARVNAYGAGADLSDCSVLDKLSQKNKVCFGKTGVITETEGRVVEISGDKELIAKIAVSAENGLKDPVAQTILNRFKDVEPMTILNKKYVEGRGVSFDSDGKNYIVGSKKYLNKNDIEVADESEHSVVYIAENGKIIGAIYIDFPIKSDAEGVVTELGEDLGISSCIVSADTVKVVENAKNAIGAESAVAGASAAYKAEYSQKDGVLYVGNENGDKSALDKLDVSITLGDADTCRKNKGRKCACVKNGDIKVVPYLLKLARRMKKIENQNKIICFAFKAVALTLGVMLSVLLSYYYAFVWAILVNALGDLIVFLNSCRNLTEAV